MNKNQIFKYVKLYKGIAQKYQIYLSESDLEQIYQIVLLVFQLDDLYDLVESDPKLEQINKIKIAMISLMPNPKNAVGIEAVESLLQAMQNELTLTVNSCLKEYLQIARNSIGAAVISGYLANKMNVKLEIWHSRLIVKFNQDINTIIRLANDYLDPIDRRKRNGISSPYPQRRIKETPQIKALYFYRSKAALKLDILYRCVVHKLVYWSCLFTFKYLKITEDWGSFLAAIFSAESVLDWAIKVYFIDQSSCQ